MIVIQLYNNFNNTVVGVGSGAYSIRFLGVKFQVPLSTYHVVIGIKLDKDS